MSKISVDFAKEQGPVKPMHAVNNGPVYKFNPDMRITNMDDYKEAGIPFARTHDSSFCSSYGGRHTVDVHSIFPDFDADENDPASYEFLCTDEYLKVINFSGAEVFYRLGTAIEHEPKKIYTVPPKDFGKWARICEHIIRHYNEGWNNGFHMNIRYWEIWNEADGSIFATNKTTWSGTEQEFIDMFRITADHLKACFPDLKIGGPSASYPWKDGFTDKLLKSTKVPIDFFSWHTYTPDPHKIGELTKMVREHLDAIGMTQTESILAEWNYVRDWYTDDWEYSLRAERSLKGGSFVAACMTEGQRTPLDILMYYDARPCGMNCLFEAYTLKPLKGYSVFHMYNRLYRLGTAVESDSDSAMLFPAAAKGKKGSHDEGAVFFTYFDDDERKYPEVVTVECKNAPTGPDGTRVEFFLLDEYHSETPMLDRVYPTGDFTEQIRIPLYATVLVRVTKN